MSSDPQPAAPEPSDSVLRSLPGVHRHGLGAVPRRPARPDPGHRLRAGPPRQDLGDVPRRADRRPRGRAARPYQRHRLPLPRPLGLRAPHRAWAPTASPTPSSCSSRWPAATSPACTSRPRAPRTDSEFYASSRYGEMWVGQRESLAEMSALAGLPTAPIGDLEAAVTRDADSVVIRVLRDADPDITALVDAARGDHPVQAAASTRDAELEVALSELRLVKDAFELEQMRAACRATATGFEAVVAELPDGRRPRAAASAGSRASSGCTRGTPATRSATTRSPPAASTPARCTGSATTATSTTAS